MKDGAGADPFADDEATEEQDADAEEESAVVETEREHEQTAASPSTSSIPWKFRRDGVQDGRDRVPLFLLEETKRWEREFKAAVENELDEDVSLTDLREAAYRVAMRHQGEVADELREWGYDFDG